MKVAGGCKIMAQCMSSGFMPPILLTSVPSGLRYSAAVAMNGLLEAENTSVAVNRATTISVTPRAAHVRSSLARRRACAWAAPKAAMSHVQSSSEPWRPAHTALTR